jgi:hypothetical protein
LGSSAVTQHGHCWSISPDPTTADNKTTFGGTSVNYSFTSNITGLSPATTYYVRAYVITATGTYYGNTVSFTTSSYILGESYGGGIIAYIDATRQHGIIISPNSLGAMKWHNGSNVATGATGTGIGLGAANTAQIIAVYGTGNYAASVCYNLMLNDYSDWVLPNRGELYEIRNYITGAAWSSTEYDANKAYCYYTEMYPGSPMELKAESKDSNITVRAIRYF